MQAVGVGPHHGRGQGPRGGVRGLVGDVGGSGVDVVGELARLVGWLGAAELREER